MTFSQTLKNNLEDSSESYLLKIQKLQALGVNKKSLRNSRMRKNRDLIKYGI